MSSKIILSIFDSIPTWVMILPILICSVVLVAVMIERVIFYRRLNIDYRLLLNSIVEKLKSRKIKEHDISSLLHNYSGPLIEMISLIIGQRKDAGDTVLMIRSISEKSITKIEKYGGLIATIATVSPMLGLLGTITGMMKSFSGLSQFGSSAQELLAQGISEAMITTALGLLVAIPSIIFYNYMISRIEHYIKEVEYIANALSETIRK